MSIPINVDAYSGHRADERPIRFTVNEEIHDIASIEDRWQDPDAEYFRVLTMDGRRYLLRYDQHEDSWTLQSGFDGDSLLARPGVDLVTVSPDQVRAAVRLLQTCERCDPDEAEVPFDWLLGEATGRSGMVDLLLPETVRCPNCQHDISEKTLVHRVD